MRTALSRRTGPVFMDVPIDVFFGAADLPEATEHLTADLGPPPDPDAIASRARLHPGGEAPGRHRRRRRLVGARRGRAQRAGRGGAPSARASTAWRAACCPPGHPLFFPRARGPALRRGRPDPRRRRAARLPAQLRAAAGFRRGRADSSTSTSTTIASTGRRRSRSIGDLKAALAALADGGGRRAGARSMAREAARRRRRRPGSATQAMTRVGLVARSPRPSDRRGRPLRRSRRDHRRRRRRLRVVRRPAHRAADSPACGSTPARSGASAPGPATRWPPSWPTPTAR